MEGSSQVTSFSERLYRVLLVAYPSEFRLRYGEQLVQAFEDLYREELEQRGKIGLLVLWTRTLGDLAVSVFSERSGFLMSSPSLIRLGGAAFVLGGILYLVTWWLFFTVVRFAGWFPNEFWSNALAPLPQGPAAIDLATGLIATGLLILGTSLIWGALRVIRWAKVLITAGTSLAALSVVASIVEIVVGMVIGAVFIIGPWSELLPSDGATVPPDGATVPPGSLQAILLDIVNPLTYWGLALASLAIGGALMFTRVIGRWWVLLPVTGILTIPQTTSLLTSVTWWLSYDESNPTAMSPVASVVPHAIVASGWIAIGFLLVSKRSGRLGETAHVS